MASSVSTARDRARVRLIILVGQCQIIIVIIIIVWLVQWILPSMPVDFVLDDRQLSDQC